MSAAVPCRSPSTAVVRHVELVRPPGSGEAGRASDALGISLLRLLADLPRGHPDRAGVRERLVELYLPLARYCAQRFRNRG